MKLSEIKEKGNYKWAVIGLVAFVYDTVEKKIGSVIYDDDLNKCGFNENEKYKVRKVLVDCNLLRVYQTQKELFENLKEKMTK